MKILTPVELVSDRIHNHKTVACGACSFPPGQPPAGPTVGHSHISACSPLPAPIPKSPVTEKMVLLSPHSNVVIQCFVKCHSCSMWTLCLTRGGLERTLLSAPGDLAQPTLFLAASLSLPAAALTFFLGLVLLLSCFSVVPEVEPRALHMLC